VETGKGSRFISFEQAIIAVGSKSAMRRRLIWEIRA